MTQINHQFENLKSQKENKRQHLCSLIKFVVA